MPKKQPKNAYFFYMLHFKEVEAREGRHYRGGLAEISAAASDSWKAMTPQQRGPFEQMAKNAKHGPQQQAEKYTSQGIPLSHIRQKEIDENKAYKIMLATIQKIVRDSYINNTMGSQEYYFISGNYFCVTAEGVFYPAELALVKFTLDLGVVQKFHTYVNPEKLPLGFQYDAKSHSEETHQLPIPPKAKGEKNYALILTEINKFLGDTHALPPMFTMKEEIPMIESFLNEFCEVADGDRSRYSVYPLHQLFFDLKNEAATNSIDKAILPSIHIAEAHLRRDQYVFSRDISCNYHDDMDCAKYCALSSVQRWAYTFADHICRDLDITLVPGQHLPQEIDVTEANSTFANESRLDNTNYTESESMSITSSQLTFPKWERQNSSTANSTITSQAWEQQSPSREDSFEKEMIVQPTWERHPVSDVVSSSNEEDFPTLGSHGRHKSGASKKRALPPARNPKNPWNASSSSSDNSQMQDTGFSNDLDFIALGRSYGRGSELFRNSFQAARGRGNPFNDRSLERDHARNSSHRNNDNRYHPWRSDSMNQRDPRRKH